MIEFMARTDDGALWEFTVNEEGVIGTAAYVYQKGWRVASPVKFDRLALRDLLNRAVELDIKTHDPYRLSQFLRKAILALTRAR